MSKISAKEYKIVAKSKCFNKKWYLKTYPDVAAAKMNPARHYCKTGWREGRNPGPNFDTKFYLKTYKDAKQAKICPLLHYEQVGKSLEYNTKPAPVAPKLSDKQIIANSQYFDRKWYYKKYQDVARAGVDAASHYLNSGWREGRNPGPNFDTKFYLKTYMSAIKGKKKQICPLLHYEMYNKNNPVQVAPLAEYESAAAAKKAEYKLIKNSKYFDRKYYLTAHSDVARAGADPVYHYLNNGWREGRNPSPEFNTCGYLKRYPECTMNPLVHYERHGRHHGYVTGTFIDEKMIAEYWRKYKRNKNIDTVMYSCVSGGYDDIISDFIPNPEYKYVLFTDNPKLLQNETYLWWHICPLAFSEMDNVRNACWHKLHPHVLFPDYKYSVWVDSNVQISGSSVYDIIERHKRAKHKIAISLHPNRDCIYEEANACIVDGKDNPALINTQMTILRKHGFPKHAGLYETNLLLRRHMDKQIIDLCNQWWAFIRDYSRHDQLSFNYLLWKNGIKHYPLDKKSMRYHPEFKLINHNYKPAATKYQPHKILVHLHLYYHDQLDWFLSRFKNITCEYDLFVTVTDNNADTTRKLQEFKPDVKIIKVPNRGYDIYPFWLALQQADLGQYDAVLKVHTKNYRDTVWNKEGIKYTKYQWRDDLINPLIGSRRQFKKTLKTLRNPDCGMVFSKNLERSIENDTQKLNTQRLCELFGYKYRTSPFSCGTMFIIKSNVLKDFIAYPFKLRDFASQSATGSLGTLAHSIETFFGIMVVQYGLSSYGIHNINTYIKAKKRDIVTRILTKKKKYYANNVLYIKHSKYFNRRWYLRTYPDVAKSGMSAEKHYLVAGGLNGYNPGPRFDSKKYLVANPDVMRAGVNPLLHWEKYGKYEGRKRAIYDMVDDPKMLRQIMSFQKTGVTTHPRSPRIIISMTTFPGRIHEVPFTIYSLLRQTIKPDEIVLYLGYDKFKNRESDLPESLLHLTKCGLTIKWVKDLRSFTKLLPALSDYPDDIVVTADDDIYYNNDWLEKLCREHIVHPRDIICHRVHRVSFFSNGRMMPYNSWPHQSAIADASYKNFLTGVGGVLYPPHCLHRDVTKVKTFQALCPFADDIWFWAMAVLNGTKIRNLSNGYAKLEYTNRTRELGLNSQETLAKSNVTQNGNDVQMVRVLKHYPNLLKRVKAD